MLNNVELLKTAEDWIKLNDDNPDTFSKEDKIIVLPKFNTEFNLMDFFIYNDNE